MHPQDFGPTSGSLWKEEIRTWARSNESASLLLGINTDGIFRYPHDIHSFAPFFFRSGKTLENPPQGPAKCSCICGQGCRTKPGLQKNGHRSKLKSFSIFRQTLLAIWFHHLSLILDQFQTFLNPFWWKNVRISRGLRNHCSAIQEFGEIWNFDELGIRSCQKS